MTLTVPPMPSVLDLQRKLGFGYGTAKKVHDLLAEHRQGWAEAERLETEKESHEDAHWYEVGQNNALRSQFDACYTALGTTFYMDPPDGGDPGLAVMVGRMKAHRDELIATVRERERLLADRDVSIKQAGDVLISTTWEREALRTQVRELAEAVGGMVAMYASGPNDDDWVHPAVVAARAALSRCPEKYP